MPNDHVSKALFQLTCRSMKDKEALRDTDHARYLFCMIFVVLLAFTKAICIGIGDHKGHAP